MPDKTVAQKAHVKPGTKIAVINPVPNIVESLGLPADTETVEPANADIIMLFVGSRQELETDMPPAVESLAPGATLWVFFRKGSKSVGLDMGRDDVWAAAERMGMGPLGLVSVDDVWSVFRLRVKA